MLIIENHFYIYTAIFIFFAKEDATRHPPYLFTTAIDEIYQCTTNYSQKEDMEVFCEI